jgi:hypothetical protein
MGRASRRGGALTGCSVAVGRWQGVVGEHRGSSGETPGMVTRNSAHRRGVVDDEAARWQEAVVLGGGNGALVVAGGV